MRAKEFIVGLIEKKEWLWDPAEEIGDNDERHRRRSAWLKTLTQKEFDDWADEWDAARGIDTRQWAYSGSEASKYTEKEIIQRLAAGGYTNHGKTIELVDPNSSIGAKMSYQHRCHRALVDPDFNIKNAEYIRDPKAIQGQIDYLEKLFADPNYFQSPHAKYSNIYDEGMQLMRIEMKKREKEDAEQYQKNIRAGHTSGAPDSWKNFNNSPPNNSPSNNSPSNPGGGGFLRSIGSTIKRIGLGPRAGDADDKLNTGKAAPADR